MADNTDDASSDQYNDTTINNWAAEIMRYRHGIEVSKSSNKELETYVQAKTRQYTSRNCMDDDIWDLFQDDFKDFKMGQFKLVARLALQELRDCLRTRGVFVPKNNKVSIAETLVIVVQEEDKHVWTDDELLELVRDLSIERIKSVQLNRRLRELADAAVTAASIPTAPVVQPQAQAQHQPQNQQHHQYQHQPQARTHAQPQTQAPPTPVTNLRNPYDPVQPHMQVPTAPGANLRNPYTLEPQTQDEPFAPSRPTNQPPVQRTYGKQILEITKMYTDEQKYSGNREDSLDYKLVIFYDICSRVDLPQDQLIKALPVMLKGLAQDHFYNNILSQCTLDDVCNNLRNFFEGPGYHRRTLDKWNSTTLNTTIVENPDKTTYECLQLLINNLYKLQYGLEPNLRSTSFLHNKLITACEGIPACRFATSDPPTDFVHLFNKLQSSIMSYEKEQAQTHAQAYFTDRRYYRNSDRDKKPTRHNHHSRTKQKAYCWVCARENCRSWKHTDAERLEAKERYKSRFNNTTPEPNSNFERRFKQYVTECEENEASDSGTNEAFQSLVMDMRAELDSD